MCVLLSVLFILYPYLLMKRTLFQWFLCIPSLINAFFHLPSAIINFCISHVQNNFYIQYIIYSNILYINFLFNLS